jgi:hypothetical protein
MVRTLVLRASSAPAAASEAVAVFMAPAHVA